MRIAAYVLLSVLSLPAAAPLHASDRCTQALTGAASNELLSISQRDREAYHYRRVCRIPGVDVAAEFEKARVSLGLSHGSRDEYCSAEGSRFEDYELDYLRTATAVEKAFQVWLECHRLNRAGIIATPIVEPERLTLTLQRGSVEKAVVHWVKANAGTKCFGRLGNGKLAEIRTDANRALEADEPWTLVCDRVPADGYGYPATIITVDTTAGVFQMKLPAEPLAPERWASRIAARLDQIGTSLTTMSARIDSVSNSIPNAVVVTVGRQQGILDATHFAGQQQDTSTATHLAECGGNSVLSAFKSWQSASAAGYYYKCGTLSLVRR